MKQETFTCINIFVRFKNPSRKKCIKKKIETLKYVNILFEIVKKINPFKSYDELKYKGILN